MMDYSTGLCVAMHLTLRIAEAAELRGDSVTKLRAELERTWLQFTYVADDHREEEMKKLSLWNADVPAPAPVSDLESAVEAARQTLLTIEAESATRIGKAREALQNAQGALDDERLRQIAQAGEMWRVHASELRQQAAEAGDKTITISVTRLDGMGGVERFPEVQFLSSQLLRQADAADATAALCENWVGLDWATLPEGSNGLAERYAELEWPPTEAEREPVPAA